MRWALYSAAVALSLASFGCCQLDLYEWESEPDWDTTVESSDPPHIVQVEVPEWPPVGPQASVTVSMTDDDGLSRLFADFTESSIHSLTGQSDSVTLSGYDLGEGYGDLILTAYDVDSSYASRTVSSLLVDLTPPEIVLMNTTVRRATEGPNTTLELWVADAWVLGSVELAVGDVTLEHDFPEGFPETLATTWDASLVRFDAIELPEGRHTATLYASDAAGNLAEEHFELLVDTTRPLARIDWPISGLYVADQFKVRVAGEDEEGDVQLELWAGGSHVTTVLGPEAAVELDASEYLGGPLRLGVVAIDEAGNRSEEAACVVVVQ